MRRRVTEPLVAALRSDREESLVGLSALDEARFGIRVARASISRPEQLASVLDFCRDDRVRLLIARTDDPDLATLRALQESGLALMDVQVTWTGELGRLSAAASRDPELSPLEPHQAEEVRDVSRRAFRGYLGHYHSDARLEPSLCDEVYADWAWRSCQATAGAHVLVARVDGRIVGFGAVRMRTPADGEAVLSGVDPAFRGRGIFTSINRGRALWCRAQGAIRFTCTALATNLFAQRAHLALGLRPSHASYTLHRWFDEDA